MSLQLVCSQPTTIVSSVICLVMHLSTWGMLILSLLWNYTPITDFLYIILQLCLCQLVQFWHHFDLLHLQKGDTHRSTQGFHQLTNYTIIGESAIWNTIGELSLVTNTGN